MSAAAEGRNGFGRRRLTCHVVLQESAEDGICILRSLLKVTNQVGVSGAFYRGLKEKEHLES